MMRALRIFGLLMTALMLFWIAGCGDDDDDDDCCASNVPPTVTLLPAGGDIFGNTIITAKCSKVVETLTISTGAIATSSDNKVWIFSLAEEGAGQSITVECIDACGDVGSAIGTYHVGGCGCGEPELDGEACNPKDGANDVDPEDVSEITLFFSESLSGAEITNFEPEADISSELDGDTLTISFLGGYSLPNEQEVVIELTVEDLAGNTVDVEYSFTTKAKE